MRDRAVRFCVVLCCAVRCAVLWGMLLCDVVLCGDAWCRAMHCCLPRHGGVRWGMVNARCSAVWEGAVRCGTFRSCIVPFDDVMHTAAQLDGYMRCGAVTPLAKIMPVLHSCCTQAKTVTTGNPFVHSAKCYRDFLNVMYAYGRDATPVWSTCKQTLPALVPRISHNSAFKLFETLYINKSAPPT